jgi:transcriptional regulator with XRE-family HTH domain
MKDRLIEFMQAKNLTAGRLAEIIGVQPSAISHITSGRNKPGYDFITNLAERFPQLNMRWFLLGEGSMFNDTQTDTIAASDSFSFDFAAPLYTEKPAADLSMVATPEPEQTITEPRQAEATHNDIERIVVLFEDGTFKEYRGRKE